MGVDHRCNQVLDGYFFVTSMTDLDLGGGAAGMAQVPGPVVGAGPAGMLACLLFIAGMVRKYRPRLA
jgi:hypothetical protein